MRGKHAVIVGGSIGGLFAGNLLIQRGWTADILERARENLASRGTGIARHAELEAILRGLGIPPDDTVGIDVSGRTAFGRTGEIIAEYELPQQLGAWNRVFEPLAAAFPDAHYHNGASFADLEDNGAGIAAHTADGRVFEGDVLIAADGFASSVRAAVAPETMPEYGGYVAWRGVSDEKDLSAAFREETFHHYAFLFPARSQLIGYPMAGADGSIAPGRRRYNYLWYYPARGRALTGLLTDANGRLHEYGIPPPLLRPEHVDDIKRAAREFLPARFLEAVEKAHTTIVQPIYDVDSPEITFGRTAIIGDAAFVARPHVGVGVLKAAQDALAIADALAEEEDIPAAMARYRAERFGPGARAVRHGRLLGAFIERGLDSPLDDPSLNLPYERIIRVSGRPYEHVLAQGL